jgi:hypothetical protein
MLVTEFDEEREESLNSAKTIFDLVTVTLARIRQYSLLSQKAELTMKLAFRVNFYLKKSSKDISGFLLVLSIRFIFAQRQKISRSTFNSRRMH